MPPENSETLLAEETGSQAIVLEIRGMRCDNCATSAEKAVAGLEGVERASVSFALEEARIEYDPARVDRTGTWLERSSSLGGEYCRFDHVPAALRRWNAPYWARGMRSA